MSVVNNDNKINNDDNRRGDGEYSPFLKVDHDFEYTTKEGRKISIIKDERLVLLEKTNSDWWKVVRNNDKDDDHENLRRNYFYVPVTYVTEFGFDRVRETPSPLSVVESFGGGGGNKSVKKDVEKWLSNTVEGGSPESAEEQLTGRRPENIEESRLREIRERIEIEKKNLLGSEVEKTERRGLDRFRNVVRKISNSMNNASYSTDEKRKSSKVRDNPDNISPIRSPNRVKDICRNSLFQVQKSPSEISDAGSRSFFNDDPNTSGKNKRQNYVKVLPKPSIADKKIASPGIISAQSSTAFDYSDNAMKILNDKRKSWAVEELMSELTQIRRETGVDSSASKYLLRSVEIKDKFDPLVKLTQELHDLHCSNSCTNRYIKNLAKEGEITAERGGDDDDVFEDRSKRRVSQSSVNNNNVKGYLNISKSPKRADEFEEANILNDESRTSSTEARDGEGGGGRIVKGSLSKDKENYVSTIHYQRNSNQYKSDTEVDNECVDDCNIVIENFEKPSYSNVTSINKNDKRENSSVKARPELRLKISNVDAKIRLTPSLEKLASEIQFLPASRSSIGESDKETRLSPSKCVYEKFEAREEFGGEKNLEILINEDNKGLINVKEDREMWKNFQKKLNSRGTSIKSETDGTEEFRGKKTLTKDHRYFFDDSKNEEEEEEIRFSKSPKINNNLKKSATFNCSTVPEYYKHFQRHAEDDGKSKSSSACRMKKRRSRSLEDMRFFLNLELKERLISLRESGESKSSFSIKKPKPIPKRRSILPSILNKFEVDNRRLSSSSKSYENVKDESNSSACVVAKPFDAKKSTAVSFKNLLCTSDSGSDEYLHYKSFPKSGEEGGSNRNELSNYSSESLPVFERTPSDEFILSSNISSEALFSQSESEAYALSELSNNSSPVNVDRQTRENFNVDIPTGWKQEYDHITKQYYFVNVRGEKWFSSNDEEGKIYFFEENSNESSWVLPIVSISEAPINNEDKDSLSPIKMEKREEPDIELRHSSGSEKFRLQGKAKSMVVGNQTRTNNKKEQISVRRSGSMSHDWPQLFNGNMCILKEGVLQRTKITENGKRLRKNWSSSYVVLSELFLLFFKDSKTFSAMKSGQSAAAKPDISIDLNGATIEIGEKASSRKNVYLIGTILGLQVLIQTDSTISAGEWFKEINNVIKNLPSSLESKPTMAKNREGRGIRCDEVKSKVFLTVSLNSAIEDNKKANVMKIGRSRSVKIKKFEGSSEDLTSASSAERQTKIKAKLKRFFQRRPTVDLLVKNGIYKDEPAFGSFLKDVCPRQPPMIPRFVKSCIEILESNIENMKTDGLYRASGNLSQIQKIRLQVDQNNFDILAQEEDVHVLTGALKLFFRELKEPLIPYQFFERALKASMSKKKSEKIQVFRDIVGSLSTAHYDTLQFLLQHLLKVTSYQEYNRMHIPNLAIVFGPTLMWPEVDSANMALDLMQQNFVIECLLSEYDKIFK